ncbi:hypothetical protein V1524DRAFT_418788 [Lipomyces starkeyi]
MVTDGSIENNHNNAYYQTVEVTRAKAASTNGFVVMLLKQSITAVDNKVYAYFYNNDGAGGRNVAFGTHAGYAFHFTTRNDFAGRTFMTAGDLQCFVIAGSCVSGEYEWPYTRKGAHMTFQGWMA